MFELAVKRTKFGIWALTDERRTLSSSSTALDLFCFLTFMAVIKHVNFCRTADGLNAKTPVENH